MLVKNFEDLEIWKTARRLAQDIYRLTAESKFSKDYRFRDQIRSAVISIMSNIAEGFERGGNQEFVQFLYIAKSSCGEVRSQLYVAVDQAYVMQKLRRTDPGFQALIDHDQQPNRLSQRQRHERPQIQ